MVLAHANWLAAHGHEVEIRCNVVDTVLKVPVNVRMTKPWLGGIVGTVLSAICEKREADIVIASIIPMACFLYPHSRRKLVYFAQDYDESYYTSRFMKGLVRLFYLLGLSCLRIPTIAVSKPLAELLRERFKASVEVTENGVDTKVFYPEPDPELVKAKEERRAILLLSRSDRRKGFDIAKEVMARLSKSHMDLIEVWTVGEPCSGFPPELIHRDFGYVDEVRLRRILSSCDLFLYPSRHEGLPLMPLEAFSCKCPVLTTTAVPYAVDGKNSLVTAIEDIHALYKSVIKLMEDPLLAEELAVNGALYAKESSLESASVKFAGFLEYFLCR
jgi:glycosyltransferase involved in cell wall biosynthesis